MKEKYLQNNKLDERYLGNTLATYAVKISKNKLMLQRTSSGVVRNANDCRIVNRKFNSEDDRRVQTFKKKKKII